MSKSCRSKSASSTQASKASQPPDESDGGQDNIDSVRRASINVIPRGNSILVSKEDDDEAIQQALYPSLLNKP